MKKIIVSLMVLLLLAAYAQAEEQKPLQLWVPYDSEKPDNLNQLDNKYIFIQDSDLEQIKNSTPPRNTNPGDPPVSYQVSSADYFAYIKDDEIKIKGVYKIDKLDDKWVLIPLLSAETEVKSALIGESPAPLTTDKNFHSIPLKSRGSYTLTLNFTEKTIVALSQNTKTFGFAQPVIPITTLVCKIDDPDTTFEILGAVAVNTTNTDEGSKAFASLLPTGNIQVKWTPKSTLISDIKEDSDLPPSANAVTYTKLEAGRGTLKGTFTTELDIRRSALSKFEFYVPDNIEIDSIYVQDNELVDPYPEVKDNILSVELVSPVEGRLRFGISYRQNFEDSSFRTKIPAITFVNENIDRETGFVALVETTNIESSIVEADETKNYREIDVNELEGDLRGVKPSIAIKYNKNKENIREIPYDITVNIVRHKDVAVYEVNIENTNITSVINKSGGMLTKAIMQVRNTSKQFLDVTLPDNSTIWSVYVNNKSVKPALKDAKKGLYSVPLVTSAKFPVEIVYFTEKTTSGILPIFTSLNTELVANSVYWNIYVPKDIDFTPISAFSNLIEDKNTYRTMRNQSTDKLMTTAGSFAERVEEEAMSLAPSAFKDELRQSQGALQYLPSPQNAYRSKKVGKLPVYVDLPLVGNSHKFYQLTFEANQSPKVTALYLNSYIPGLLKLLVLIAVLLTAFKNTKIRQIWLPHTLNIINIIKNKLAKLPKPVIKNFLFGIIFGLAAIFGIIYMPGFTLGFIFLSITAGAIAGVVLLIRFMLKKWRAKNNENQ